MSRLRSPNQPKPLQALLWLIEALASLQLAVVLIALFIVVLAYATLVDEWYGSGPAQFGIYGAWWFLALGVLLGLNVLLSVLVRFPWQRRQTGFVVTHLGILVLLIGSLISYRSGVMSSLAVYEGQENNIAVCSSRSLEIRSVPAGESDDALMRSKPIIAPLRSGPFSWSEYGRAAWLPWKLAISKRDGTAWFPWKLVLSKQDGIAWLPWKLVEPTPGVVYQGDGLKLEILDFLADSRRVAVPRVKLSVRPVSGKLAAMLQEQDLQPVELGIASGAHGMRQMRLGGTGERRATPLGQYVTFSMARSEAETAAFLACRSEGKLDPLGQIVLFAGSKLFRFSLAEFQKKSRLPLGETGLEVELVQFEPAMLGVQLRVINAKEGARPMTLFASLPHFNRQDELDGVYGEYYVNAEAAQAAEVDPALQPKGKALEDAARPRIDILQGHDQRLYYRTVRDGNIHDAGPWPTGKNDKIGQAIVAFAGAPDAVRLYLEEFHPRQQPELEIEPVEFRRGAEDSFQPRARLRLSLSQQSKEFWLAGPTSQLQSDQEQIVTLGDRKILVVMPQDRVELGFAVKLNRFSRKLDPGASRAAHYGSLVDILEAGTQQRIAKDVEIKVNGPVDVADPQSGKTWRLFQASFGGPWKPGSETFDQNAPPGSQRKQIYRSIFSANYDPGRGMKYAGSLLIVAGIWIIYYMRAYFFARRKDVLEAKVI